MAPEVREPSLSESHQKRLRGQRSTADQVACFDQSADAGKRRSAGVATPVASRGCQRAPVINRAADGPGPGSSTRRGVRPQRSCASAIDAPVKNRGRPAGRITRGERLVPGASWSQHQHWRPSGAEPKNKHGTLAIRFSARKTHETSVGIASRHFHRAFAYGLAPRNIWCRPPCRRRYCALIGNRAGECEGSCALKRRMRRTGTRLEHRPLAPVGDTTHSGVRQRFPPNIKTRRIAREGIKP